MSESPTSSGTWLRFRFYVAGQLVTSNWLDCSGLKVDCELSHIKNYHLNLQTVAEDLGEVWMVEIYDPDLEPSEQYIRMGTDPSMMPEPIQTTEGEMVEVLKHLRLDLEA